MPRQPVPRRQDQSRLLGGGDAGCRATKIAPSAQTHLDKHRDVAVAANQIDFAALDAEIAGDNAQSARFEHARRVGLEGRTPRHGGSGVPPVGVRRGGDTRIPGLTARHRMADMNTISIPVALYVVATPIGNLGDIGPRALDALRAADVIACEDTRHTRHLLDHFGIRAPAFALHEHNEREAAEKVITLLAAGKRVALVSDAGTPGISDPGAKAVAAVRAAGFDVVPLPGPSAAITALSAAGLADERFLFVGFLPAKVGARGTAIDELAATTAALVFYEAPHRIEETVADLAARLQPSRTLVIARELSKRFEQIAVMPLGDGPAWLAAEENRRRGEFVLIVAGPPPRPDSEVDAEAERVLQLLLAELPTKQAAKLAAAITGRAKNALYARALEIKGG